MKVLITGITGFVGSHMADFLMENPGVEVWGLKRWWESMDNVAHLGGRVHYVEGDLTDLPSLISMFNLICPDVVFHLAAESFVPASFRVPVHTMHTNAIGTVNLLEALRLDLHQLHPVVVIYSSPEVYGDVPENELPITEGTPLRPLSPYALSKVAEDRAGYMYAKAYGLRAIISRGFAHEGPRRAPAFAVSDFAKQIAEIEARCREPVVRVGNLDSTRTYCDVRDMVRAYWLLAQKGLPGEAYNIAGDETMTVREMLNRLLSIAGLDGKVQIEKETSRLRPHDVTRQIADDAKFRQLTGWKPMISFSQTLADVLAFWQNVIKAR